MICAIYQNAPEITINLRYEQIHQVLTKADALNADFICFPEGFLTGYYDDENETRTNSLNIHSFVFNNFVKNLNLFRAIIIIGFNEIDEQGCIFDSAAIIEKGELIGVQRKHYQYHEFCSAGDSFIPFFSKGIYFGVIICLDSNYFEPSRILAVQGATILFVPCCNKVRRDHPLSKRPDYYSHFAARAHENRCWLLSADWISNDDPQIICPGHSAIYDSNGAEIARSKELVEDLLVAHIPDSFFQEKKGKRVYGSKKLWNTLKMFYE